MQFQMGIVKGEIKIPELMKAMESFKVNRMVTLEYVAVEVKKSVSEIFIQMMSEKGKLENQRNLLPKAPPNLRLLITTKLQRCVLSICPKPGTRTSSSLKTIFGGEKF